MQKLQTKRTMGGMRESLFVVIDNLICGELDPSVANSITSAANCIINSVKAQVNFEVLRLDSTVPAILPAMALTPNDK